VRPDQMPTSSATKAGIKVLADIVMKDSMRLRCSERCYFKALIWQVRSFTTWSLGERETQQEQVDRLRSRPVYSAVVVCTIYCRGKQIWSAATVFWILLIERSCLEKYTDDWWKKTSWFLRGLHCSSTKCSGFRN